MSEIELIHGDCIPEMQKLINHNTQVDMVLTDIPYGTTECKWDNIIPFEPMWECIKGLRHDRTPILLFGNEPFSSSLRLSNIREYKYDWVWNKENSTNVLNARYMPLKPLEYISVFYKKAPTFNPIRRKKTIDYDASRTSKDDRKTKPINGVISGVKNYIDDGTRHPINLITFNSQREECNNYHHVHPTQKPVRLLEYLIKTYTNEGDTVIDFTMGSGSTGVACRNLNRKFIGIELDDKYYKIAEDRILKDYQSRL